MTTRRVRHAEEQGVSESIGFLLTFTIIIAGIGLVTLYGYPLLTEQQISADEKIMEKNLIVLQNDIKSLAYKTVPYKETSLKIGGGTLSVYNPGGSSPVLDIVYPGYLPADTFKAGELRYESVSAKTDIALENGAVILRPRIESGSTMLAEPRWFYDEDPITHKSTMVINLINVSSDSVLTKEGIGTVQMRLMETPDAYQKFDGSTDVIIKYYPDPEHDYSVAWGNYFTHTLGMVQTDTNPPTFKKYADTLVIKKYEVKIVSI